MIKFSKQVDYAFQLILELSKLDKGELLSLKKFSNKSNISFLFLQKIAKALREAGIIESVKGKSGGYRLKKEIDKINMKEVIEAIDGPYSVTQCFNKFNSCCKKASKCSVKRGIAKINKQMVEFLEKTTIKSFLK